MGDGNLKKDWTSAWMVRPWQSQLIGAGIAALSVLLVFIADILFDVAKGTPANVIARLVVAIIAAFVSSIFGFFVGWLIAIMDKFTENTRTLVNDINALKTRYGEETEERENILTEYNYV